MFTRLVIIFNCNFILEAVDDRCIYMYIILWTHQVQQGGFNVVSYSCDFIGKTVDDRDQPSIIS